MTSRSHNEPANCSLKRPRSPSTEPICSPESSPGRFKDENQNPIKVLCRPALDRAMSIIRNREPDQHQCYFCGTIFPNGEVLQAHRRIPHCYKCDQCPRRFASRSELERHHLHPEGLGISSSSDCSTSLFPVLMHRNEEAIDERLGKEQIPDRDNPTKVKKKVSVKVASGIGDSFKARKEYARNDRMETFDKKPYPKISTEPESSHYGKDKSQSNVSLLQSSVTSSPLLDQELVHNSHARNLESNKTEEDKINDSCSQISSSPSSPGFLQSFTAGKNKFRDNQNFNDFLNGVVTISSDSDSGEDSHFDEAPELKMSSDDESVSSGFLHKSPLSSSPFRDDLPKIEPKIEISIDENFSAEPSTSPFRQEAGDNLPNIEPKIEIDENFGVELPQDLIEVKKEPENNLPPHQKQNQTNEGQVSDKCVQCGVPIRRSNFASNSGSAIGGEELKCFQCQPQVFFQTLCPICEEQVETANIQHHLEHAHHEVVVLPCKMCHQMMRKHDIIPHMKVCGENGGKPRVLCPLCKKDMLKTSLALHMQTHMNRPKQQCPHCDSKVLNLKSHIMRKHSNVD